LPEEHNSRTSEESPDRPSYEDRAAFRPPATGPWWCRHPKPDYPTPTGCRRVYIPIYGYLDADDDHRDRVENFFHIPMLILALLVLPVLGVEYLQQSERQSLAMQDAAAATQTAQDTAAETASGQLPATMPSDAPSSSPVPPWFVRFIEHPVMLVTIDVAMAFIWFAFLLEFVVKIAVAPSRLQYATKNWIDIVIILLPMLRVFRSMRAFRALRAAKVARATQVYRLRGIAMKLLRTVGALVLGLEAVNKLRARFQKPGSKPAPPDYTNWSRAALISEIDRLKDELKEMTKEKELWKRRYHRVQESRKK